MAKIARNKPCPCGSGKKFKKCCIKLKKEALQNLVEKKTFCENTSKTVIYSEVDKMSIDDKISKLKDLGIQFNKDRFLLDIEKYHSVKSIADKLNRQLNTKNLDNKKFVRFAITALWLKLGHMDNLPSEELVKIISIAKDAIREKSVCQAADYYIRAYHVIMYRHNDRYKDLNYLSTLYQDIIVRNVFQDIEIALQNAGSYDDKYHTTRIKICQKIIDNFPQESEDYVLNMYRAVGDSYAFLENYIKAEEVYEKLIKVYPNNPWSYIGYGDIYYYFMQDNYDKAVKLFHIGLSIADSSYDRAGAQERLDDINNIGKEKA